MQVHVEVERSTPYAGVVEFGDVGAYERVDAVVEFGFDPADPGNERIADLGFAERSADGLVHARADLVVLRSREGRGMILVSTAVALLTATVAVAAAERFRLPGGALTWALVAVGALYLWQPGLEALPSAVRVIAQILIAIVIGSGVSRAPFRMLRTIARPARIAVGGILGAAVFAGVALGWMTDLPTFSAFLAVVPGGASDVTAVALELDQDVAIVAGFQMVRQLTIFGIVIALFEVIFRSPPDTGEELDG